MAFSFVASVYGSSAATGTTLSTSTTLNVQAGDILVAWFGAYSGTIGTPSISDGGSNSFTMESTVNNSSTYGAMGIKLNASANYSATFTLSTGSIGYRYLTVLQFRNSSSGTASKDVTATGTGSYGSLATGSFTTTGTDEIVVIGAKGTMSTGWSSMNIGGSAADGSTSGMLAGRAWYKIYTATKSSITGTATGTPSSAGVCAAMSVKFTASGISIPLFNQLMMRGRRL